MRIAFFSDNFYPEISGIADSIMTTGRELGRRGHKVRFFAPTYPQGAYEMLGLPEGNPDLGPNVSFTRFASFPYPGGTGTGQGRMVIPTGLRFPALRSFHPDLIHVHLPFGACLEGVISAKILGVPIVATDHTPISEFLRYSPIKNDWFRNAVFSYNRWFYNQAKFLSSPSAAVFAELGEEKIIPPHHPVSNPLKTEHFYPRDNKKELKEKFGLGEFTILYVGRLAPEKKIDETITALAALGEKAPGTELAIVGRGGAEGALRKMSASLGVADKVKFLGFLNDEELPLAYAASDVFAIMSTAETQSIAAMQAMMTEVPVVAARAWGLKEYVNEKNGILVEPGDVAGLTSALLELYSDRERRLTLGQGGREFASGFSITKIADAWEKIYQEVIAGYNQSK